MTQADLKIQECIKGRHSFLLDAGAGSGKTSSLVKALNYIRGNIRSELVRASQKVACVTFTNVAKDEIVERIENDPLFTVSTIHDFLWRIIKPFQKELKAAVLTVNDNLPDNSRRKKVPEELADALDSCERIVYSDRGSNFMEGRIFHDDLLDIAQVVFAEHQMLSRIVAARYPFIFVDEYQDTSPKVIDILLKHILECGTSPVVGLFGDKWQSIYPNVIGEIPEDLRNKLKLIQKEENYRCSVSVINLLNHVRKDIQQNPAGENVDGSAVYINLNGIDVSCAIARASEIVKEKFNWPEQYGDAKVLYLTHRLIARRAGYEDLWTAYNRRGGFYKDRFQSGEDDIVRFFYEKIEPLVEAWNERKVGKAVSIIETKNETLASADVKRHVTSVLDQLAVLVERDATIKDVLEHLSKSKIIPLLDDLESWLDECGPNPDSDDGEKDKERVFFQGLFAVSYRQVRAYRDVLYNDLPYSTKHGVKGDEFETVFVILDDDGANWNQYSFEKFLSGNDKNQRRFQRTRNLFYVCCSRSKNNLAVIDLDSPSGKERTIHTIFGAEACVMNNVSCAKSKKLSAD